MFLIVVYVDRVVKFDVSEQWDVLFLKQRVCQDLEIDADIHYLSLETSFGQEVMKEEAKLVDFGLMPNCRVYVNKRQSKERKIIFCYECEDVHYSSVSVGSPSDPSIYNNGSLGSGGDCSSTETLLESSCPVSAKHKPVVYLKHVKQNCNRTECAACSSPEVELLFSFCDSEDHSICTECFKKYAKEYFDAGMFQFVENIGYTIGCPAGCPASFLTDPHHFRLLGPEFYSHYKEQSVKRYLVLKGGTFCPSCGLDWQVTNSDVTLPCDWHLCVPPLGCASLFCSSCGWHCKFMNSSPQNDPVKCLCEGRSYPLTQSSSSACNSVWKSLKLTTDDRESRKCISETCHPCPRCKSPTQKFGGCNHIHCSLCGLDWCWVCCDIWTGQCISSHWL
uniref:RBR-type E3 ubiquitin transferase n=1 Tax=Trichobilharzia regenti TaxID=157069 RepID=A0AA85JZT8_TRIRE|nr:unnamed protein product [Trichobilharzia regenti]